MKLPAALVFLLTIILLVRPSCAHDYWLKVDEARYQTGHSAAVKLMFGDPATEGNEKPLQIARTAQFRCYGQSRKFKDLLVSGEEKAMPAARLPLSKEGTVLVTMERTPSEVRFGRAKFLQYAASEGAVISDQELPPSKPRVRERYARFMKTLLQVGDTPGDTATKKIGEEYEIVPVDNPYAIDGGELVVKVFFRGKPAAGAKVSSIHKLDGKVSTSSRITDARGRCALPITRDGQWHIRSVKIVPDAPKEGPLAGYHSYWASLTFRY
ncbi:MAG TPA: DUF4198 domain-containing protein [Chthoniobacterales bacterium]|jgi:uncharacterized GH25 family protein